MTMGDTLLDRLTRAYHSGNTRKFLKLCLRHAETIVGRFGSWSVVPVEMRHDQEAISAGIQVLVAIAEALEALGYPEPMLLISPDGPANPVNRWNYAYRRAQQLNETSEYAASSAELRALLEDMRGSAGPGVEDMLTKVLGLLGINALRLGLVDEALHHTEEALGRCRAAGDVEGVWIYTENLETLVVAKEVADGTTAGQELTRTRRQLVFAQDLSDARRYQASSEVLHELLDVVEGTAGTRYLGKIYGLLGLNSFRLDDVPSAERFTQRALSECRDRQDYAGERIYTANLAEIGRRR